MSETSNIEPDVDAGINYWSTQPANYDGVLGGFGTGSLPRVDALGSRQFLLHLLPELSTVPSAIRPLNPPPMNRRTRALDVGAGVGRVTSDVLLHLFADVVLVEPVESLVNEAWARGCASEEEFTSDAMESGSQVPWKGIQDKKKSVTFLQGTLQSLDPSDPPNTARLLGRVGYHPSPPGSTSETATSSVTADLETGFDVIWCQWCLGHLSDTKLVAFLKRCQAALRDPKSMIVVKENTCTDAEDGGPRTSFDEEDSTLTRSDLAFKKIFEDANLKLVREQVQRGFPEGLYVVRTAMI